MADREKLIALLKEAEGIIIDGAKCMSNEELEENLLDGDGYGFYADYLIANGVTVQKWIPIADLPMDKSEHYITCDHKGNMHVMFHHKCYDDPFGIDDNHPAYFPVMWFMPLPEPPKGE